MTEHAVDNSAEAAAARAAEQTRLRKERREAKIKAGGSARLNKITGLGGGMQRDPPAAPPQPAPTSHHDDPEEVDISRPEFATSATDPTNLSDTQLRQMMLGQDPGLASGPAGFAPGTSPFPSQQQQGRNPFLGGMMAADGQNPGEEDPMLKMLNQMMSGGFPGMPGGAPGANAGFPPMAPPQQQQSAIPDRYTATWRLLHFVVAAGLGLYIALLTPFAGTKLERDHAALVSSNSAAAATAAGDLGFDADFAHQDAKRPYFFYAFATAEAVLLTSRFFLDSGRAAASSVGGAGPLGGILSLAMGFLPPAVKQWVDLGLRYARMFTTLRSDIMVCVFVLGVCSLVRAG